MKLTKQVSAIAACIAAMLAIATGSLAYGLPLATVLKPFDPVMIDSGMVAGKMLESGVEAWFGVPYAKAPVRELRWRAPQPIEWPGTYNADRFAPQCIQPLRDSNINHYFGHEATSEDCLYLNIWAPPGAEAGDGRPVVVWIYGGAYMLGSAAMRNYSGESLAKKGVVYVSVSYRVGALGFLAHPELTAESPHKASGNYGMLDQVSALQWVRRNIAKFGGDPKRVTIMGQSAGSMSVSALQVSPLARKLFQGVVGMSGSAFTFYGGTLVDAERQGRMFQEALGVDSIADLRHIAADRILAKQFECQRGCPDALRSGPIVDGYFMPEPPTEVFGKGEQSDVPILLGFTRDEGFSPIGRARTLDQYRDFIGQAYSDKAAELLKLYPAANDADAARAAHDVSRDSSMNLSMQVWADLQIKYGKQPAYPYMFARVHPYTPGVTFADHDPATVGAYHTADVPYWLQTLDSLNLFRKTRTYTDYDRRLADLMSNAIVSFATSGNPSTGDLRWPAYTPDAAQVVGFGLDTDSLFGVIGWPNAERLDFFRNNEAGPVNTRPAGTRARD